MTLAGRYFPQLAQGVAFAAKARDRAGNQAAATDLAAAVICGMPAPRAAQLTDEALVDLAAEGAVPVFEIWRRRIQANWSKMVLSR